MFFDTHVHFHFPEYDGDRERVLERALQAGVERFINVGTNLETSKASLKLAESHPFIHASAGLHPHDAKDAGPDAVAEFEQLLADPKMAAIGEIGLDFFKNHSPREKQIEVLEAFLGIYRRIQKPLIIHCRDAYEEMEFIFRRAGSAPYRGVMHCFSSDERTMTHFIDLGFYISFAGPLTYKKNDALRKACKSCPEDRLVFETDAPFLPPQSKRGKRNESAYMRETIETAAQLRHLSLEALGEITTQNALRLFHS